MTYHDYLIRQAEEHWQAGQQVPSKLLYVMLQEGINVDREHHQFNLTNQGM
jgi:hypothetical protein